MKSAALELGQRARSRLIDTLLTHPIRAGDPGRRRNAGWRDRERRGSGRKGTPPALAARPSPIDPAHVAPVVVFLRSDVAPPMPPQDRSANIIA